MLENKYSIKGFFGQWNNLDSVRVIWAVQLGYFSVFPAWSIFA
jgi:hypothetical protein